MLGQKKIYNYLLYAIGEILLVVIGILLALEINNWNEEGQRRNAELIFYENIKTQISRDREQIRREMDFNSRYTMQFKYADEIIESNDRTKTDTLGQIAHNLLNYSDFDRQGNIYETVVNSGQIELLRNHNIIDGIRSLEELYIYINRLENIHYDAIIILVIPKVSTAVKLSDGEVKRPENLYTFEFQNLILTLLRIMEEKDQIYQSAVSEIEHIIALIDEERPPGGK
jgi:hypothetical protein